MLKQTVLFLVLILSFLGCQKPIEKKSFAKKTIRTTPKKRSVDTLLLGDLNHDRVNDTIFVINPLYVGEEDMSKFDCIDKNCEATVRFSNGLPTIELTNAIGAEIENLGDIDRDGYDELLIVHSWFIGCRANMYFYTFQKNRWTVAGHVGARLCEDEKDYKERVTQIAPNTLKVKGDTLNDDYDIIDSYRIIKLK